MVKGLGGWVRLAGIGSGWVPEMIWAFSNQLNQPCDNTRNTPSQVTATSTRLATVISGVGYAPLKIPSVNGLLALHLSNLPALI